MRGFGSPRPFRPWRIHSHEQRRRQCARERGSDRADHAGGSRPVPQSQGRFENAVRADDLRQAVLMRFC